VGKLSEYKRKRAFAETPEPRGRQGRRRGNRFCVQMHDASRLHWDLRLEIGGVLKSWAVPKGPTLDPGEKRLAVQTEDHPLEYLRFEEVIPAGQYGAGPMMVWDVGTYETPPDWPMEKCLFKGEIKLILRGKKLRGSFVLVKIQGGPQSNKGKEWLLIKHRDEFADRKWKIEEHQVSVVSGRTLGEIGEGVPPADGYRQLHPAELTGAREADLPHKLAPMLSTLGEKPFSDPRWIFEIKWDGVRALAWVRNGTLEMRSRNGNNITAQYPELSSLPQHFDAEEALLDGEIVVLEDDGRSSFGRLQQRMHVERPSAALRINHPVVIYLFDLLYCDGFDLRESPLRERKQLLRQLLAPGGPIRFSDHQAEHGKELYALAQQNGLEGIIAKHGESAYVSNRSTSWLKLKVTREVDAVIGGWTEPRHSRQHFGALSLGLYEGKMLRYIGGVGTGFDEKMLAAIMGQLKTVETKKCPFAPVPKTDEAPTWTAPKFVARVRYGEWTGEKHLRHPVFIGLRNDVRPEECVMESVAASAATAGEGKKTRTAEAPVQPAVIIAPALAGKVVSKEKEIEKELFSGSAEHLLMELDGKRQRLSNLNKIYFPESRISKRELLAYYYRLAPRILPYLQDRPMVLRRYPNGITGEAFFQKEAAESAPEWMETTLVPSEHHGREVPYFLCNDRSALLYLTNLGCIDHNPWPSRGGNLEEPDYFFFDLDPTDDTPYDTVVEVARKIYERVTALGLRIYPKTSGASGFHLFLPLAPGHTYEQVRMFAEIIARLVAAEIPQLVTMERAVTKRPKGRVLIDFVQNAFGRPLASAWSARAYPQAPVSMPLFPEELKMGLDPARFNIRTALARLEKKGDAWATFWKKLQHLSAATRRLGQKL
jgi:bifunctional non-homologous end joining protein LigD